jgi:hypothetical protein
VTWELGRRDVLGLFQPADYPGFIFEIELTRVDLDELTGVLQAAESSWAKELHNRILERLEP